MRHHFPMDRSSEITIETESGFFETSLGELPELLEEKPWIPETSRCRFKDSGDEAVLRDLIAKVPHLPPARQASSPKIELPQSTAERLALVLQNQARQDEILAKTSFRVGCLFAYLISSLILGGIGILVSLIMK
jgi:hypothetical protein